jgi:hypothetical protein
MSSIVMKVRFAFWIVFQPVLRIPIEIGPKCDIKDEKFKFNEFQMIAL